MFSASIGQQNGRDTPISKYSSKTNLQINAERYMDERSMLGVSAFFGWLNGPLSLNDVSIWAISGYAVLVLFKHTLNWFISDFKFKIIHAY